MTIPIEIVAAFLTVFGGGLCTAIGFVYVGISQLKERVARVEEHLGITPANETTKRK